MSLNLSVAKNTGNILFNRNNIRPISSNVYRGIQGEKGDKSNVQDPELYLEPNEENQDAIELWINRTFKRANVWWGRIFNIEPIVYTAGIEDEWEQGYRGGVLLTNKNILMVPFNHTNLRVFNVETKTFTEQGTHGYGPGAFSGGVNLKNGKTILVPYNSTHIGFYFNSGFFITTNHQLLTAPYFDGGVLLPHNGWVCMIPARANRVGLVDTSGGVGYENSNATFNIIGDSNQYSGGVLLSDGRVVLVPHGNPYLRIYNPIEDKFDKISMIPPEISNVDRSFSGGVLGRNGIVYMAPYNAQKIGMYNPTTDEWTISTLDDDASIGKYTGGVLLRNGNILFIPHNKSHYLEYNPETDIRTLHIIPSIGGAINHNAEGKYYGGIVTENGSVCAIPHSSNHIDLIDINDGNIMDKNVSYSPFFNKL